MITGAVNRNIEARIQLTIHDINGQSQETEAVIDTGFSGYLTLPFSLITLLGLPWHGRQPGFLADGRLQFFDVYEATVIWDGQARTIEVEATDSKPLIGMDMMRGYDLQIQVESGGTVTIKPL